MCSYTYMWDIDITQDFITSKFQKVHIGSYTYMWDIDITQDFITSKFQKVHIGKFYRIMINTTSLTNH